MLHIPLAPGSKKPLAGENWKGLASSDEEVIQGWRAQNLNVGLLTGKSTNNIVVRDFDGEEGIEIARQEFRNKLTREFYDKSCLVRTPSGGLHQYLRAPEYPVPNAVKVGGKPIDLRSDGAYVVAAGSWVKKKYVFVEGFELRDVEDLPIFPEMWLPPKKEVLKQSIDECDVLKRITRARLWLATVEPAVSGRNGHKAMFRVCCQMFQKFKLTPDQAFPLVLEYNERCLPPFSVDPELTHKITSAWEATKGA